MEPRRHRGWGFLLGLALALGSPLAALEIPTLTGRVVDNSDLLSPEAEAQVVEVLTALEQDKGAQLVVLTIPSLEGEVLEDFAHRVFEDWKLGRAEADDGVLLLIVRDDRKLRLEVGYGLEGALPDALARRVLDEKIVPRFRDQDYPAGIMEGVRTVAGLVRGDLTLPPPPEPGASSEKLGCLGSLLVLGLFGTVFGVFVWVALVAEGLGGYLAVLVLAPFFGIFPGVFSQDERVGFVVGGLWVVLAFAFRLWLGFSQKGRKLRKTHTWLKAGSSSGGGSSWSSSSGSSSSGGGYSGGGGSSGGGGASSSW